MHSDSGISTVSQRVGFSWAETCDVLQQVCMASGPGRWNTHKWKFWYRLVPWRTNLGIYLIILLQKLEETKNAAATLVQHQLAIDMTIVVYVLVTQTTIENLTHCMVILPLYMSRYNQEYITSVHSALGSLKCISLGSLSPAYQPNKTKDTPPGGYHNLGGRKRNKVVSPQTRWASLPGFAMISRLFSSGGWSVDHII